MLNIENLKCGFGKHEILHGISLTIPKGQITAIVGQSGCGKTTFLKTLNRMVEEEGGYLSGTITLEGTDIKSLPKEKLRRRVGMVQRAVAKMVIEKMQVVGSCSLAVFITDRISQLMKWPYLAVRKLLGKRINTKQADKPLVEHQLIVKLMLRRAA